MVIRICFALLCLLVLGTCTFVEYEKEGQGACSYNCERRYLYCMYAAENPLPYYKRKVAYITENRVKCENKERQCSRRCP